MKRWCEKHGEVEFLPPNMNGDSFCPKCLKDALGKVTRMFMSSKEVEEPSSLTSAVVPEVSMGCAVDSKTAWRKHAVDANSAPGQVVFGPVTGPGPFPTREDIPVEKLATCVECSGLGVLFFESELDDEVICKIERCDKCRKFPDDATASRHVRDVLMSSEQWPGRQ